MHIQIDMRIYLSVGPITLWDQKQTSYICTPTPMAGKLWKTQTGICFQGFSCNLITNYKNVFTFEEKV